MLFKQIKNKNYYQHIFCLAFLKTIEIINIIILEKVKKIYT